MPHTPLKRLRVLTYGASETNHRRHPVVGTKANVEWSNTLRKRCRVNGFWPMFLMHGLDARVEGRPYPTVADVEHFGRLHYLYDRNQIYQWWKWAELHNAAIPGTNVRALLKLLEVHGGRFRFEAPDLVITCVGAADRSGYTPEWVGWGLMEFGYIEGMDPDSTMRFAPCEDVESFGAVFQQVADKLDQLHPDALQVYIGLMPTSKNSRRTRLLGNAIDQFIREEAGRRHHGFASFDFMSRDGDKTEDDWLHLNHPTDEANRQLAWSVLEQVDDTWLDRWRNGATRVTREAASGMRSNAAGQPGMGSCV